MAISIPGSGVAGETFSLVCSATLITVPLPSDVPAPTFEWFHGINNSSLPSGVTPMETVRGSGNTYISTLQFSPLYQSYSGMYTCRLGAGRMANSTLVNVTGMINNVHKNLVFYTRSQYLNLCSPHPLPSLSLSLLAPTISVWISATGLPTIGRNEYKLTCHASGAENIDPSISYIWLRNYGTPSQIQFSDHSSTLSFSNLSVSDAGQYTCLATIASPHLINDITAMGSHIIKIQCKPFSCSRL